MIIFKERDAQGKLTIELAINITDIQDIFPNSYWGNCSEVSQDQYNKLIKVVGKETALALSIKGVIKVLEAFEDCFLSHYVQGYSIYWMCGKAEKAIYNFYFGES